MIPVELMDEVSGMWAEAAGSAASGMRGLGFEASADNLDLAAGLMDIMSGAMIAASSILSILEMRKAAEAAQAAMLTTAYAASLNWAPIVTATAAAAVAGTAMYALTRHVRANSSNPGERRLNAMMGV